ncbi:MAG: SMC-Scp complex subunit ScpB [bacterium]
MNTEQKIEAILLFRNEPVSLADLSTMLKVSRDDLQQTIINLQTAYANKGIVIVSDGEKVSFGTHPDQSALIEEMQKDELSRELGRAGLETLAIVAYKGPISRREIDHIRGVNSSYTLRTLMVRGLIERTDSSTGERGYSYKPTLELLRHLGITRREDLPDFEGALSKIKAFEQREVNIDMVEGNNG